MMDIATIGHNKPPLSPFDEISSIINDLYDEAKAWLDGEPVTSQEQANALNTLESRIRDAEKRADDLRKEEAKPHDDAKAEIQARYNPLIGKTTKITGKTVAAIDAVKSALKPYLVELDRKQREEAEKARREAEEKQRIAMEAMRERDRSNLEQSEEAERLVQEAKESAAAASKAENAKAHAKGEGRATGLRSVWVATVKDKKEAAAWAWLTHQDELIGFIQGLADREVRNGKRSLRGFEITETKVI